MCTHVSGFDAVYYLCGTEAKSEVTEEYVFFFKAHLEHMRQRMVCNTVSRRKDDMHIRSSVCVCCCSYTICVWAGMCIPGSCGQMYGHGLDLQVSV